MARAALDRTPDALLKESIETLLRTISGWMRFLAFISLMLVTLTFLLLYNKIQALTNIPSTKSYDSLVSFATLWLILLTIISALELLQGLAIGYMSRHIARRLAVPAVLATATRAGRPEAISTSAINDIETLRAVLGGPASSALVSAVTTPLLLVLLFALHWLPGIIAVGFCTLAGLSSLAAARAAQRESELTSGGVAHAYGLAVDAMRSGEAVLAMGMLPRLGRLWIKVSTASAAEAWLARRTAARFATANALMSLLFRGAMIFSGATLTLTDPTSAGALGGLLFLMLIIKPFNQLGNTTSVLAEGLAAWRRLRALVASTPQPPEGIAFPCPHGRLVVEHMSFGFRGPQPPLLRNIELVVEPGEIVAIVGASGSGKSTLLRTMVGLYRPGNGGVYLDGHAPSQWDRRDFARHVGFLPQDPLLSRGTAAEVIARLEQPDMALVLEAAHRGGAHDAIAALPQGYATQLLGNFQLSMGQRHRVALARALYGRPKLLLLDELAGSLDPEGEAHVIALLDILRREGTSVVFTSHRPGLIVAADRVMALRNGTLVPAGEELPRLIGAAARQPRRIGAAA